MNSPHPHWGGEGSKTAYCGCCTFRVPTRLGSRSGAATSITPVAAFERKIREHLERQHDVLEQRHGAEQRARLEHHADTALHVAQCGSAAGAGRCDHHAVERDASMFVGIEPIAYELAKEPPAL